MPSLIKIIRIEGGFAYVPLTKGFEAVIDVDDVDKVKNNNWYALGAAGLVYAARMQKIYGVRRSIYLHRVITICPPEKLVDHVDCNTLDNRRANLRICTRAQNTMNTKIRADNKTGFKGVDQIKASGRWRAAIKSNGAVVHLGHFGCATAAAVAYRRANQKYHKDFGRIE